MNDNKDPADPVREALIHGEAAPSPFASWPAHEGLRRLRMRFGLSASGLAARAGMSPSLVGRAEKGADIRWSTLQRLYAALGCRLIVLPAGALFDLDWDDARRDDEEFDARREIRLLQEQYGIDEDWGPAQRGSTTVNSSTGSRERDQGRKPITEE